MALNYSKSQSRRERPTLAGVLEEELLHPGRLDGRLDGDELQSLLFPKPMTFKEPASGESESQHGTAEL